MPRKNMSRFSEKPTPADAADIRRIVVSNNIFSDAEVDIAVEMLEETLKKGARDTGYHFLFARDDTGHTRGYACHGPDDDRPGTHHLYWIAVDELLRGKGIGSLLLERAEQRVRGQGGHTLLVETSSRPQYALSRRFYELHGFDLQKIYPDYYGEGDDLWLYRKRF